MSGVLVDAYRFGLATVARAVSTWSLEPWFVRLGHYIWRVPGAGPAYRRVASQYASHLRQTEEPWRPVRLVGATLMVDVTEFTTYTLFFGGVPYEPRTTAFLQRTLRPGAVFVDVGANHGYFTLIAAALVGSAGRVHAFEPNPAVAERLEAHIAANTFGDRVVAYREALGDAPAVDRVFYVSQDPVNSGLSSLTPWADALAAGLLSPAHTIGVTVDTFDRWRRSVAVPHVDVVKIDAEQGEDAIVAGMAESLNDGCIDAVVCETTVGSRAHRALCDAGFDAEILDPTDTVSNIGYVRRR